MRRRTIALLVVCSLAGPACLEAQSLGVIKPGGKEPTLSIGGLLQVQTEAGGRGDSSEDTNIGSQPAEFGFDSTPSTPDRDNIFSGKRLGTGIDTQLQAGHFDFWAEALRTKWEPTSRRPSASFESEGWYAQGSCYVIKDRLQVVLKAETFDPRTEADGDETDTGTAGVNWYLKGHDLKLQMSYMRTRIENQDDQDKVLARIQVIF